MENIGSEGNFCNVPWIGDVINTKTIPAEILHAYYYQVDQPADILLTQSQLHKFNHPYSKQQFGAYIISTIWTLIEKNMGRIADSEFYSNWTHANVSEGLKEYAKGFQYAYDNFEAAILNNPLKLLKDEFNQAGYILEYLYNFNNLPSLRYFNGELNAGLDSFKGWFEDGITAGYRYRAWLTIFENSEVFEPFFIQANFKIEDTQDSLMKDDVLPDRVILDPLTLIEPMLFGRFLEIERKVTNSSNKFPSQIRCAAFCEMLYDRKFILHDKHNQKRMNDFARSRYKLDIINALSHIKNPERTKHKNHSIGKLPPLRSFF